MNKGTGTYIVIDLKSFYASVECVARKLDPLRTNLVVADVSRTEKTICLAVSPSLKAIGISGRARLFEVVSRVKEENQERLSMAPAHRFTGRSADAVLLADDPGLELDYIAAPPRMSMYISVSTRIYDVYLRYFAPEDMHVYSIDEVMIDATSYLKVYQVSPRELASRIVREVLQETGITATAGIGTNLYLAKVAMDIVSKHAVPDQYGVRIAELDEMSYRRMLWNYRPLRAFWRVGRGISSKLEERGIFTMGDIARCSLQNEDMLYRLFGVNAELLIDHAWGYEPCTMEMIKKYRPDSKSFTSGQVLSGPYSFDKARIVVQEMAISCAMALVEKKMLTRQVTLTVGYDISNKSYTGERKADFYGRMVPRHAHGTAQLDHYTSSDRLITEAVLSIYDRTVDRSLYVRRITLGIGKVIDEKDMPHEYEQMDLFTDYEELERQRHQLAKEKKLQQAMLSIRHRFGANAVLKGINLEEGATGRERNNQIGGHKKG